MNQPIASMNLILKSIITGVLLAGVVHAKQPNILWLLAEDSCPDISCYGERAIKTPTLDAMAAAGVRFDRAFVTAPVCSPSRSAVISGLYQTTSGFLNHRSQEESGKGKGGDAYLKSYLLPATIKLVPQLFKEHGYYVSNEGKTDYNFIARNVYDSTKDWSGRKPGQPFFAQIQLTGGKFRRSTKGVDVAKIQLPSYYPDTELFRKDWAEYLGSWVRTDQTVSKIMSQLESAGELDNTIIFFWTDHGVSHIRGKQFLYDEGTRVPLIVRFPDGRFKGTVRSDMVSQIDIPVTSLALADIPVPGVMQGRNLFAADYKPQRFIYTARDRCDETVDIIRSVRTERFKYIRNFLPYSSHMQPNQYKEDKDIVQEARRLWAAGKLTELQARVFAPVRPVEELYDLVSDPEETVNLASHPDFSDTLTELRNNLKEWMVQTRDMGLIPEPIAEDMGKQYGSKYAILLAPENQNLVRELLAIVEAGERGDAAAIKAGLASPSPSIRYWAVKAIGNLKLAAWSGEVEKRLKDTDAAVRIAAADSYAQLGHVKEACELLNQELVNPNLLAGLYAVRVVESIGLPAKPFVWNNVQMLQKGEYEFTKRVVTRLVTEWKK